jgi:hypothetical protein
VIEAKKAASADSISSEAAPEIEFPTQAEAALVGRELLVAIGRHAAMLLRVHVGERAAQLLHLRVQAAAGNAEKGAALEDAEPGNAKRWILGPCRLDQLVQRCIVEEPPPELEIGASARCGCLCLAVEVRLPVLEPANFGFVEVRSQQRA